jgi:hypothetical protein
VFAGTGKCGASLHLPYGRLPSYHVLLAVFIDKSTGFDITLLLTFSRGFVLLFVYPSHSCSPISTLVCAHEIAYLVMRAVLTNATDECLDFGQLYFSRVSQKICRLRSDVPY